VGRRNTEGGGARWTQLGLTGGAVPEDHPSSPDENSGLAVRESGGTTSLRARPRSQASLGGVCQQVPGFSVTVCGGDSTPGDNSAVHSALQRIQRRAFAASSGSRRDTSE
jgi:hypothetical protein